MMLSFRFQHQTFISWEFRVLHLLNLPFTYTQNNTTSSRSPHTCSVHVLSADYFYITCPQVLNCWGNSNKSSNYFNKNIFKKSTHTNIDWNIVLFFLLILLIGKVFLIVFMLNKSFRYPHLY